jgi:hypothetical protein
MADPADVANLSQLDIQNLPPEEQARLARAQQQALARQQFLAEMQMQSVRPELQKAGETEYAQAGRERAGGKEQSANVLKLALEKTSQERQLAALQQQIEYQRGQLGLQGQQLGASILSPLIPALLGSQTSESTIKAFAGMLGGHWGEKLGNVLSTKNKAEQDVIMDFLKKVGMPLGGSLPKPTVPKPKSGAAMKNEPAAPVEAAVNPAAPAAAEKIRVRNKQTGKTGSLSPQFFNPNVYEKLPEP